MVFSEKGFLRGRFLLCAERGIVVSFAQNFLLFLKREMVFSFPFKGAHGG
jgi:hypothetical protein